MWRRFPYADMQDDLDINFHIEGTLFRAMAHFKVKHVSICFYRNCLCCDSSLIDHQWRCSDILTSLSECSAY